MNSRMNNYFIQHGLTLSLSFQFSRVYCRSPRLLLLLLALATLVEVLDDDPDEHVQDEESDEEKERDEVQETPFVVVDLRLRTYRLADTHTDTRTKTYY